MTRQQSKFPADEQHADDRRQQARHGQNYADKGSHGKRHEHTHLERELEKRERREIRKR